jgi:hypothetical protein
MDWIDVAQEMVKSLAAVNAVMTFLVPYNAGNFLTMSSPEGLCSIELVRYFNKAQMQGKCPVTKSHIPAFHCITTFHCLEQQSMNMGVKTNFITVS